ncbi:hypothetical protein [Craterilacuibacter sinensis]|uniref:Phage tail protein n=1 Tax=Craterilacuibacter sinensis TaxID=2686017 RepID=A0A845BND6_9NEIS|nr:hypothetical protein [Craterilacuibacter sinensis]MXR36698.1 hypothetical protein [Craterilacuibacter sinensis]
MQRPDTPDGLFRDGNPSIGELGTTLSAAWLNAVQAELISVLADRGITVDPAKSNQLLDAIKKIAWGGTGAARPTTLAGYGITDATAVNHSHPGSIGVGTDAPSSYTHGGSNVVCEVKNAMANINSQAHSILTSGADLPNSAVGTLTWVNPRGLLAFIAARTGSSYDGANAATRHVEIELRALRAGISVSRYRIAESGNQVWNTPTPTTDDGTPFQFYGAVRADSPAAGANNNLLATTAWVRALLGNKASFSANDWMQIGPLIIQWVEVTPSAGAQVGDLNGTAFNGNNYLITLPTAFPNGVLRIIPGIEMQDDTSDVAASVAARRVSNGQIRLMAGEWAAKQQNIKLTAVVIGW